MSELRLALVAIRALVIALVLGFGIWHRRGARGDAATRQDARGPLSRGGVEPSLGTFDQRALAAGEGQHPRIEVGDLEALATGVTAPAAEASVSASPSSARRSAPADGTVSPARAANLTAKSEGGLEGGASEEPSPGLAPGRDDRARAIDHDTSAVDPGIDAALDESVETGGDEPAGPGGGRGNDAGGQAQRPAREPLLVVLTLMAPRGEVYDGARLRQVLEGFDLHHGDMGLFHYYPRRSEARAGAIFSVANALEPGSFELDALEDLRTPGVCVFMQLPGPLEGVLAFDVMLDVSTKIARELGAEVRDQHRSSLSAQATARLREQVIEYSAGLRPTGAFS